MKVSKHQQWRKKFPYYKVQYWDYKASAWHDIQRRFANEAEARSYGIKMNTKYRVMKVLRTGRYPI